MPSIYLAITFVFGIIVALGANNHLFSQTSQTLSGKIAAQSLLLVMLIILTLVMTYPLICHPGKLLPGQEGDPLLNTWLLAWSARKIANAEISTFLDANIFYPHSCTLAYTDYMPLNTILALPVNLLSDDAVAAYNFVFLLSFILTGFNLYLLAHHLSGDRRAAFVAALFFAFFPWKMASIHHLQIQSGQWLPLIFLCYHKFWQTRCQRWLLAMTVFWIFQFLSCGYYGLFVMPFIAIFTAVELRQHYGDRRVWLGLLGCSLLGLLVLFPLFYPYIYLKQQMGFRRSFAEMIYFSADIRSFFAAPASNCIWGSITASWRKPEGELFFGVIALLLAAIGIVSGKKSLPKLKPAAPLVHRRLRLAGHVVSGLLLFLAIVVVLTLKNGSCHFEIGAWRIDITHPHLAVTWFGLLALLRLLMQPGVRSYLNAWFQPGPYKFYLLMLALSLLLCLGPYIYCCRHLICVGPYYLLARFVPGFDGVRVPARFIMIAALALSIFIAYGVSWLLRQWPRHSPWLLGVIVPLLMLELCCLPLVNFPVATAKNIPAVYRWLGQQPQPKVILEMPLPHKLEETWQETYYMYYSLYHGKQLVNGYSGYFPHSYFYLCRTGMRDFPSPLAMGLLRELGIDYLILHRHKYPPEAWRQMTTRLKGYHDRLQLERCCGSSYVYRVVSNNYLDKYHFQGKSLSAKKWRVMASRKNRLVRALIDGNLDSYWTTGDNQRPWDFVAIDLGQPGVVARIVMELGAQVWHYPGGYRVEISQDGNNWQALVVEPEAVPPLWSFSKQPHAVKFVIPLPRQRCRYLRIIQTNSQRHHPWTIYELRLFK